MRLRYFFILFLLSGGLTSASVFLVECRITESAARTTKDPASFYLSVEEQKEPPWGNVSTGDPAITKNIRMEHGIKAREASNYVGIPNHHDQAGSLAVYSIPEPPASAKKKKAPKYWDPVIFYCTMLIMSSTLVTVCLLRNCLCPALKDDCKSLPCYECCC